MGRDAEIEEERSAVTREERPDRSASRSREGRLNRTVESKRSKRKLFSAPGGFCSVEVDVGNNGEMMGLAVKAGVAVLRRLFPLWS